MSVLVFGFRAYPKASLVIPRSEATRNLSFIGKAPFTSTGTFTSSVGFASCQTDPSLRYASFRACPERSRRDDRLGGFRIDSYFLEMGEFHRFSGLQEEVDRFDGYLSDLLRDDEQDGLVQSHQFVQPVVWQRAVVEGEAGVVDGGGKGEICVPFLPDALPVVGVEAFRLGALVLPIQHHALAPGLEQRGEQDPR